MELKTCCEVLAGFLRRNAHKYDIVLNLEYGCVCGTEEHPLVHCCEMTDECELGHIDDHGDARPGARPDNSSAQQGRLFDFAEEGTSDDT